MSADHKVTKGKAPKSKTAAGPRKSKAKPMPQRTGVVVLGMHRSGTSALSGVLHLMGCDTPATPMKTNTENEKGFFESALIHKLHNELLASAGMRWDDWLPIGSGWSDSVRAVEFHEQAVDLLGREFGGSRLFVFKDPRVCRLVPFWEKALAACDVAPRFILTHRNPLEVANSLLHRNEIDQGLGILIWLRHVLDAEAATRGKMRCFVSYDGLLENWAGVMRHIQDEIELPLPRLSVGVTTEVEAFLDIGLRHHKRASALTLENPMLSNWMRDVYAVLEKWAAGVEDKADYKTLDAVRESLASATTTFAPVVHANRKANEERSKAFGALNDAEQTLDEMARDRDSLQADQNKTLEELATLRGDLEQAMSALEQRSHDAEQTLDEMARDRDSLHADQNKTLEELASLRRDLEQRSHDAEQTLDEMTHDRDSLHADQIKTLEELATLRGDLAQATSALEQRSHEAEQVHHELQSLKTKLSDRDSRIAQMETSLTLGQTALENAIQSRDREVAELTLLLQKTEQEMTGELNDQRSRGDFSEAALESIYNSTSWRLTRPLRWLARLVRT